MTDRIQELAEQAGYFGCMDEGAGIVFYKFAKLIVNECYEHCKDQLMDKKLAEEAGLDYNDGVMDCAVGLKQHFGVEE